MKWTKSYASSKPETFVKLNNKGDWAINRFIEKESDNRWVFETAIVKDAEKQSFESGINGAATPIEKTEKSLDNNDTTLMEALADIYEAIERLKGAING